MRKKALIIFTSVCLAAGLIVLVKNIITVVSRKDDFQLFNKSALESLERTEKLAQKAKGFDQKKDKGIVLSNSLCSHEFSRSRPSKLLTNDIIPKRS